MLVTCGRGFIGSNLVRVMLSKHDVDILNLDRLSYGSNPANLSDFQNRKNYQFVRK